MPRPIHRVIGNRGIGPEDAVGRHRHQVELTPEAGGQACEVLILRRVVEGAAKGQVEQVGDALAVGPVFRICGAQRIAGGDFRAGQGLAAQAQVADHAPVVRFHEAAVGQESLAQRVVLADHHVQAPPAIVSGRGQVRFRPGDQLWLQVAIVGMHLEVGIILAF